MYFKNLILYSLLVILFVLSSCDLDVVNPNTASEEEVLETREGMVTLAVGTQQYHATNFLLGHVMNTGVTAGEMGVTTTLANYLELERGGEALPTGNANINMIWGRSFRMIGMAEDLIAEVDDIPMGEGTAQGISALAHFHKAAALGALASAFEQTPVETMELDRPGFLSREDVLQEAIDLLDEAIDIGNQSGFEFSDAFFNEVLSSDFDLENTLYTYLARFHLMLGNYQQAYDAADAVDPTATSMFTLDDRSNNEIFVFHSTDQLGYVAPREYFGLEGLIDENDGRLDFYLDPVDLESDELGLPLDNLDGFFSSLTDDIPVYIPGEILLIKAEAIARQNGDTGEVVNYINEVRTKTPDEDPLGIGADLPEYEGDTDMDSLLEEIYIQRSAELFLTGQRLEDSRRFDRPGPGLLDEGNERNRTFYPYPDSERRDNPNTPDDPSI